MPYYNIYTGNRLERKLRLEAKRVRHPSAKPRKVAEWYRKKHKIGKAIKITAERIG